MPVDQGVEFVRNAIEQENEEKLFLRWVVGYQQTTAYGEFKIKMKEAAAAKDNRSAEAILDEVEALLSLF